MKITSLGMFSAVGLIFVILTLPLFFFNDLELTYQSKNLELMTLYDGALYQAVADAAYALQLNELQEHEVKYESKKDIRVNKELAIETFFHTLYSNFDILHDPIAQEVLQAYVPLVAIVDYDGLWIHAGEEFRDSNGDMHYKHVWQMKHLFTRGDLEGNTFSFTLDDYVYFYDQSTGIRYEGTREEVNLAAGGRIDVLNDEDLFEEVRRLTIIQTIQDHLAATINAHNEKVKKYGIVYQFTLPVFSQEEWSNTIDDISVIAFLQGIPMYNQHYNNYALGGSRLMVRDRYFGTIEDGIKVYYPGRCLNGHEVIETFSSAKQAAQSGYIPRSCLNR